MTERVRFRRRADGFPVFPLVRFVGGFIVVLLACAALIGALCTDAGADPVAYQFSTTWGSFGSGDAEFNAAFDVETTVSGEYWVVDKNNHRVKKFDGDGNFLTSLGTGSSGSAAGQFSSPRGVAVDWHGNGFVTDTGNNRIQKFDTAGDFAAMWGSLGTGSSQFNAPQGIAVDGAGNVYVADTGNRRIQKFSSGGSFLRMWGWGVNSTASAFEICTAATTPCHIGLAGGGAGQFASFSASDVAVDDWGRVFVTDAGNNRVQEFDSSGNFVQTWGWGVETGASAFQICSSASPSCRAGLLGAGSGQFNGPNGVGVDSLGRVFVGDTGNHRIQAFDSSGTFLLEWGSAGSEDGLFNFPTGVSAAPSGDVLVADGGNNRVQRFSPFGIILDWGSTGTGNGEFNTPRGLALDGSGNVLVIDADNNRIQKFTPDGAYLSQWTGSAGAGHFLFNPIAPFGDLAADPSGNIYVVDSGAGRVQKFDSGAGFDRMWGWGVNTGASEFQICTAGTMPCYVGSAGFGGAGQLTWPPGIAVDAVGNVFVADGYGTNRIEKFTVSGGYVSQWGNSGSGAGEFSNPIDVATDVAGNVYVSDQGQSRIQKFDENGIFILMWGWGVNTGASAFEICTAATTPCSAGIFGDGRGQLDIPWGVAPDQAGNIYVVDVNSRRVKKFTGTGHFLLEWGVSGSAFGQFGSPTHAFADGAGNLFVSDGGWGRIDKFGPLTIPGVSTQAVTAVTTTSATGNGTVTDLGVLEATLHGVVWNTTGNPTLADSSTDEGIPATTGPFTSPMTGLSSDTTYYVRAYAANETGVAYGAETSFSTLPVPASAPTGVSASSPTTTSLYVSWTAVDGGIASDCTFSEWLVRFSPGGDVPSGCGNLQTRGTTHCTATSLTPNTSYQFTVQETCTNSAANSPVSSPSQAVSTFGPPTVTTNLPETVGESSAVLSCTVRPNGFATNTWFEWGTDTNYSGGSTTATQIGTGGEATLGVFLPGLESTMTYHYRCVAENDQNERVDGNDVDFTTGIPDSSCDPQQHGLAKLPRTGDEYATIQDAVAAALDLDVVELRKGVLGGSVDVALPALAITLQGGWNCDFGKRTETESTIGGTLTVSSGTAKVDGVVIGPAPP